MTKFRKFNEKSVVEDYIVDELVKKGWKYVPADELERESFEEPLLNSLSRKLLEINKDKGIRLEEVQTVITELKLKGTGVEGVKRILDYLKEGVPVTVEKDKVLRRVELFDYENLDKNEFIVSRQVVFKNADNEIRTDIILFVNGIPLVNIECKNPVVFSVNWYDAFIQIKEYEQKIPELYKYVQIGVAAEQIAKYFPIIPWQKADEMRIHEWKSKNKDSIDATLEMFSKNVLLDLIKNFIFFKIEGSNAIKIITRYMQYRAVKKIINRVKNNFLGRTEKNKGLIWHWQGSGKTYEMIFAANELFNSKLLENPTIFFIVDRRDLEEQLFQEISSLNMVEPEVISTISKLRKVLKHDGGRGKRGLFITLIHKFRSSELQDLKKEMEELSKKKKETIMTRKNVICFIDEGHRTQYGLLAAQMKDILRNAFFFAFTGTPLSKKGRNTFQEFSYEEENYLDKYFILDSIKDNFTVKIIYQPRLEKEVHLKKELLKTFLEVEEEEIPEELREVVKEKTRKKLRPIRIFLESKNRIKEVVKDIVTHFKENVDGKYKAMIVTVSKKACLHYKEELDKLLPREASEIVMTLEGDDRKEILEYKKKLIERFNGKNVEDIKKEIIERFKEETYPKILIVTDMLLTGFNAPILQTMYLDKPLKGHRLLQAIARTNRPFKNVKEGGLILDYVGILKEVKKAFKDYSKEDYEGALYDIKDIRKEFIELIKNLMTMFKDLPREDYSRETLLKAIEIITSKDENSKEFIEKYKRLRRIFEVLGSDTIKVRDDLLEEYAWLTAIYVYYRRLVLRENTEVHKYTQKYYHKTIKYVEKTISFKLPENILPIIEFNKSYFKKLEERIKNKKERVANIVFALNKLVLVDKEENPIYESIADKVERVLDSWKKDVKDYEKIYKESLEIISTLDSITKRRKELGFSERDYYILQILEKKLGKKKELIADVRELSKKLSEIMFNNWVFQVTARKDVERTIRNFFRKYIRIYKLSLKEFNELCEKIIEYVKTHDNK